MPPAVEVAATDAESGIETLEEVQWQAQGLTSGTYFYHIEAGSFEATRQMKLIR